MGTRNDKDGAPRPDTAGGEPLRVAIGDPLALRAERVQELRALVQADAYVVPPEAAARALLRSVLADLLL
jgi:hypothetical protein